jgi:hypothetical protein
LSHLLLARRDARIFNRVTHYREDAISVEVSVPGQRWEIDVLRDGSVDVEVFRSDGAIHDESVLDSLIQQFSDQ